MPKLQEKWKKNFQEIIRERLAFCDYHNMIAILEKREHNIDFYQIVDFIEAFHIRRATRIAQSKALSPTADEHASLLRDDSQGEAFPTVTSLDAGQDRENIIKTSALPHESTPRVTSLDADEGSIQQQLRELMDFCTGPQRQQTQMAAKIQDQDLVISSLKARMAAKIQDQDLEISGLKERVKILEDKDREREEHAQEDAPINGGSMEIGEEVGVKRSTELGNNDTEKMKKLQEQIDAQVARDMEEEFAIDNQRLSKQLARDSEIAKLHAEEELKIMMMIEGLDRSNEMIAKHLHEYEQAAAGLSIGEKIELINELVKYQYHHAKILKYQAQQRKPLSKKEQRKFYMSVLRSHAGWKIRHFRGMTLEEIKEKFIPVWKQIEDFVPMSSKEECEGIKRKGLKLDQGSAAKKMKTYEEVSEEDLKEMMQLVPVEEVYVEAFIRQATKDKEMELWVELKRLFEPDFKDQLWTHTQNLMHDPLDWKLYDTCGVHHVSTKDQEIFMLLERDYPLRRRLAIVMICNKLQVENYSQMANDLILKIHTIANSPR
nr:hypothetical protein [Tanacetum cinerariifolium]